MNQKPIDFEKLFKELEDITESLERDDVNIEKGIVQFERGLKIAKQLKERLSSVENTIRVITEKFKEEHDRGDGEGAGNEE